jgi:hypothetical protein
MNNETYSVTPLGITFMDKLSQTCRTCERTFICARGKLARETGAGKRPDWKNLYQEMLKMEDYGMECDCMRIPTISLD